MEYFYSWGRSERLVLMDSKKTEIYIQKKGYTYKVAASITIIENDKTFGYVTIFDSNLAPEEVIKIAYEMEVNKFELIRGLIETDVNRIYNNLPRWQRKQVNKEDWIQLFELGNSDPDEQYIRKIRVFTA